MKALSTPNIYVCTPTISIVYIHILSNVSPRSAYLELLWANWHSDVP